MKFKDIVFLIVECGGNVFRHSPRSLLPFAPRVRGYSPLILIVKSFLQHTMSSRGGRTTAAVYANLHLPMCNNFVLFICRGLYFIITF